MTTSQKTRHQSENTGDNQKLVIYLTILLLAVAVATFVVSLAMLFVMLLPH